MFSFGTEVYTRANTLCQQVGEPRQRCQALQGLSRFHLFQVAQGRLLLGWALAMQGDAATGVAHIQQGLGAVQHIGQKLFYPYYLAMLAEAYGQAGQPEAGLSVLDEALTLAEATEERWWEAEVYRQALAVARRQQAKSLELRAALSLSRLWQQHGKRDQTQQLLTEVYSWFTEGFETPDLQEARVWLEAATG